MVTVGMEGSTDISVQTTVSTLLHSKNLISFNFCKRGETFSNCIVSVEMVRD